MIEPEFPYREEEVDKIDLHKIQDLGDNGNLESLENHIANMVGSNLIDEIVEEIDKEDRELMSEKYDTLLETPTIVSKLDAEELEEQVKDFEEK